MNDYLVNKEDLDAVANAINKLDRNYEQLNFPEDFISKLENIAQYVQNLSLTVNAVGCEVSEYTPTIMQLSTVHLTVKVKDGYQFRYPYKNNVNITGAQFTISMSDDKREAYITIFNIFDNVSVNITCTRLYNLTINLGIGVSYDFTEMLPTDIPKYIPEDESYVMILNVKANGEGLTNDDISVTSENCSAYYYASLGYLTITNATGDVTVRVSSGCRWIAYDEDKAKCRLVMQGSQPDVYYSDYMHESEMGVDESIEDYAPDEYRNGWLIWNKLSYSVKYIHKSLDSVTYKLSPYPGYDYPYKTKATCDVHVYDGLTRVVVDGTVIGCDYTYDMTTGYLTLYNFESDKISINLRAKKLTT